MSEPSLHPDDAQLDRQRAGLLEGADREAVDDHLRRCFACRERMAQWDRLTALLDVAPAQPASAERPARRISERLQPYACMLRGGLSAAAIILTVTVGVLLGQRALEEPVPDGDRHAAADAPASFAERAEHAADVPDLYTHIDFYLWLQGRDRSQPRTNGSSSS
ncbi:MAG: hypothetical protein GWO02_12590 [Gammaproteobacteria bacterium]|nr:hypothetical protein [Gammaproteobacteria bacterium]